MTCSAAARCRLVTGPDAAAFAVVAPTSASVVASYKSSVAATTLFTVYDRDGDAITQYDFWDNGAGGGHWSINGVAQGSNVEIIVNASQLSQVTYTPAFGSNKKLSGEIKSILKPGQWIQLIDRISKIPEPVVPIAPSKYAIRTSNGG